jgi:hypothetical protein
LIIKHKTMITNSSGSRGNTGSPPLTSMVSSNTKRRTAMG